MRNVADLKVGCERQISIFVGGRWVMDCRRSVNVDGFGVWNILKSDRQLPFILNCRWL